MKKSMLVTLVLSFAMMLQAAPDLLFRGDVLPGATASVAKVHEKVTLSPEYASAGTCAFWVRPDGWDQSDDAWHFFAAAGQQGKDTTYITLFRLPKGKVRFVWSKNASAKEVTDAQVEIPFRSGEWHHFAFTWKDDEKGCVVKFYADGKLITARRIGFTMDEKFPTQWLIGDVPTFRPYSKFKSTLGRLEFYKNALSADEIASLAAQKFVDGKMSFVSRKFVPGSVNHISGECTADAVKLEAVFADEAGKEQKKELPFV